MLDNGSYDRIVYFGDSLTSFRSSSNHDIDNLGENSDTPNEKYSEIVPELFDITNVQNYAIGGATALDFIKPDSPEKNLTLQVERFVSESSEGNSGTAASILIGYNDYTNLQLAAEEANASDELTELLALGLMNMVVDTTLNAAETLAEEGVGLIVVNTLPPPEYFPYYDKVSTDDRELSKNIIEAHNEALRAGVNDLSNDGANVVIVELEAIGAEVAADPTTFGFVAPYNEYYNESNESTDNGTYDWDQYAFESSKHPSSAGHGVLAAFTAESLSSRLSLLDDGDDVLKTGEVDDLVLLSGGNDWLQLGNGEDIGFGGVGDDSIRGGKGNDIISGGSGVDQLLGGGGDDVLAGNDGEDLIRGGDGNDVLIDGLGSDKSFGGDGDDQFLFTEADLIGGETGQDKDLIKGGDGYDILYLALTDETRAAVEADITGEQTQTFDAIGLTISGVEEIIFVESRGDLALVDADAPLVEADLWGLV